MDNNISGPKTKKLLLLNNGTSVDRNADARLLYHLWGGFTLNILVSLGIDLLAKKFGKCILLACLCILFSLEGGYVFLAHLVLARRTLPGSDRDVLGPGSGSELVFSADGAGGSSGWESYGWGSLILVPAIMCLTLETPEFPQRLFRCWYMSTKSCLMTWTWATSSIARSMRSMLSTCTIILDLGNDILGVIYDKQLTFNEYMMM